MDLHLSRREFTAKITDIFNYKMFITQDEVDKALTGGRSHALSGADNSNESHDSKGISYNRRHRDDKLFLNWNKVAKRIDYLISIDHYMTAEEKEKFEEIQREKAEIVEVSPVSDVIEPIEPVVPVPTSIPNPEERVKQEEITQETTQETTQEITPIPYSKGDTVYLENGAPFLIEEITNYQVTLRDPSLYYPILRAESRESFLQRLERYPQSDNPQQVKQ